ncbi:MAG: secretin N-terminal domain-containing protein [Opitutaceae bacterium]|jgi:general secretion pathway protein D
MIQRSLRIWFSILLCGSICAIAQISTQPPSVPPATSGDDLVDAFKLSEADIDSVLSMLEMLTGRTVIRPAALPATTYTLHLKNPMPRSEAILALETLMGLNGLGIAPLGDKFIKVVPLAQVRTEAPELIAGSTRDMPASGRIGAKFFQLEHGRISEIAPQLQNLVSPGVGVSIVLFDKSNAALITDSISNLQRIETLFESLDRPAPIPKFYTLKFAKASDLIQRVQAVVQSPQLQSQFGSSTTFTADDRTQQAIIVTDSKNQSFFDELIEKLDVKADPNTRTEVLYLKHAAAKDVASLLTSVITGQNSAAQKSGTSSLVQRPTVEAPVQPGQPNAASRATQTAGLSASTSFSSIITVIPDDRTNSVVVNGTVDDIRLIKELVDKVDIILPQVRIEVVIAEISLSDNNTTGIDALGLQVVANKLVGISGTAAGAGITFGGGTDSTGATTSTATINRPDTGGYTLTGMLNLKATPRKTIANILSNPSIVTTHNKKASVKVTQEYPTISSYLNDSTSSSIGSVGTGYRSTINSKDVGITLTVTPLIGDDGSVQMDIEQEVSDVIGNTTIDGNNQPIVGKRTTNSFVTAKSGEIIVLGGLQRNTVNKSTNRLGPIPFLGDLLGTRTKKTERTDLIFFLRPVVLTNTPDDNKEAMKRIDASPQAETVKKALDPDAPDSTKKSPAKRPSVRGK